MVDRNEDELEIEIRKSVETNELDFLKYSLSFEKKLSKLEVELHNAEEPEFIAKNALIEGAEFYDADWCGVIEADLIMKAWSPMCWYNRDSDDLSEDRFLELEDTAPLKRWVDALYKNEPVIIKDTSVLKNDFPEEYAVYERLGVDSILAVPYWKNPTGFMIVRNPKKYITYSSFLQMLAYVVFTSLTTKKLIERSNKAYLPKSIKRDTDVMIHLFGNLEIYTSKGVLKEDELNSPKICRLLTYLLLNKNQPQPPRALYESIWPDELVDSASTKVKSLIYRFQNAFAIISDQRLIISTNRGYQINPDLNVMTDTEKFEQLINQSQSSLSYQAKIELLRRAIDLYRGGLLTSASGEDWLNTSELRYKYKYLGINNSLLKLYFETKNYPLVQQYANKALEIDNTNIEAYYWLIRSFKANNSEEMAKSVLRMAKELLLEEELEDLEDLLNLIE